MEFKGTFTMDGKTYECKVNDMGKKFVNDIPINDFLETLTIPQLLQFARIGEQKILNPEKSAQTMHQELEGAKHN